MLVSVSRNARSSVQARHPRRPPEGCAAEREAWGLVQGDGPAGGGAADGTALPLERVQYGVSAAPACSFLPDT